MADRGIAIIGGILRTAARRLGWAFDLPNHYITPWVQFFAHFLTTSWQLPIGKMRMPIGETGKKGALPRGVLDHQETAPG